MHAFPALAHCNRGSSVAQDRAERQVIIEVVIEIESLDLIVGAIRFGQQNDIRPDFIQCLSCFEPEGLRNAAAHITAKSVNVEIAGPMNETVSQILSDFRFTEVWQWL